MQVSLLWFLDENSTKSIYSTILDLHRVAFFSFFSYKELSDYFVEMYVPLTSLFITQTDGICLKSLPKSAEDLSFCSW